MSDCHVALSSPAPIRPQVHLSPLCISQCLEFDLRSRIETLKTTNKSAANCFLLLSLWFSLIKQRPQSRGASAYTTLLAVSNYGRVCLARFRGDLIALIMLMSCCWDSVVVVAAAAAGTHRIVRLVNNDPTDVARAVRWMAGDSGG